MTLNTAVDRQAALELLHGLDVGGLDVILEFRDLQVSTSVCYNLELGVKMRRPTSSWRSSSEIFSSSMTRVIWSFLTP